MFVVEDNDLPITVAQKIITGTKPTDNILTKVIFKEAGKEDEAISDMFDLDEIKEIADYLICYYDNHKDGD